MDPYTPRENTTVNNGLTIQPAENPSIQAVPSEEPEDFYRGSSGIQESESTSPADSQAPIMASWKLNNINETETPPITEVNHVQSEPESQTEFLTEFPAPPPPSATYLNGEVCPITTPGSVNNTPQFAVFPVPPLSAGLKTSGTTPEEQRLAELDMKVQMENRRDLAVKLKVRLGKVVLRGLNCVCSIVVLALVSSTFAIFFATRHLPNRNNLQAWDSNTPQWPQTTLLVIAIISLILSLYIMYCYWRGGHSRAERIALHATLFTAAAFIFSITIWSVGYGIMKSSREKNNDKDIWGWSCRDNTRKNLFQDTINYNLVCSMNEWIAICALIEIVVELLLICVYIFAFYRFVYTKRKLRKSLNVRDEARSNIWIAKLQSQKEKENLEDETTTMNTTYNQLNSNTAFKDAEEGHAVPILQAPPPGKRVDASERPVEPQVISVAIPAPISDFPPTPRSISFQTPPRPNTSGSRER